MFHKWCTQLFLFGVLVAAFPTNSQESQDADSRPTFDEDTVKNRIAIELECLEQEGKEHGGWDKWRKDTAELREQLTSKLKDNANIRRDGDYIQFENGFLYSLPWLQDYLSDDFFEDTPHGKNALASIEKTSAWLKGLGVHLLVVPIPPRLEVTPESVFSSSVDLPHRKHFMKQLLEAGVDTFDILPEFRKFQSESGLGLSLKTDSHCTNSGVRVLATNIAGILQCYRQTPWRSSMYFTMQQVGAQVRSSPSKYLSANSEVVVDPQETTVAFRILNSNGSLFQPQDDAPVLLIGDSYTMIYSDVQADLSAHLAMALGQSVSRVSISGGGADVPARLARLGEDRVKKYEFVVWAFTARYLIREGWERNPLTP